MVWSHHLDLGLSKQVFCDLVASKDGKVYSKNNTRRTTVDEDGNLKAVDPQFVKFFFTNSDTINTKNGWKTPTANLLMGAGAFEKSLMAVFKATHGYNAEFNNFGKSHIQHFEFIEDKIVKECGSGIKTIYMVGNDLRSEIFCANAMNQNSHINWISIKIGQSNGSDDVNMLSAKTGFEKEFFTTKIELEDFADATDYIM